MPIVVAAAVIVFLFLLSVVVFSFTIPYSVYLGAGGLAAGALLTLGRSFGVLTGLGHPELVLPAQQHVEGVPRPGRKPRDFAWPHYFAGQVFRDLMATRQRVTSDLLWLWIRAWRVIPRWRLAAGNLTDGSKAWAILLTWPLLVVIMAGLAGISVGAVGGLVLLGLITGLIALVAWILGLAIIGVLSGVEHGWRRTKRSAAHCPNCFRQVDLPTYQCPGPHLRGTRQMLHRYMRPGLQGVWWRRCGCGAKLPATMLRAAWELPASCPRCSTPLYLGAGLVPEARLALFGEPGSGKSWLIRRGLAAVADQDSYLPGSDMNRPDITMLRRRMGSGDAVIQIFDPGGGLPDGLLDEPAHDYFEGAMGLIFVVAAEEVLQEHGIMGPGPEGTYQSIVDRLRFRGVNTHRSCLAVAVTRIDQVPDRPHAGAVAEWLAQRGCENLIRSINLDFRRVGLFVCDSSGGSAAAVWRWVLREVGFGSLELTGKSSDATA